MSVKKPRFAVLMDDCENGQKGNLSFVSYFLKDEYDTTLSDWNGTFFFKNGNSLGISVHCPEKYPDEVPTIVFSAFPRTTNKIQVNNNVLLPTSEVCRDWLQIDHNKRNLDALFQLIYANFK
ncbi:hypothetical protein EIN_145910 [Entamoeba invadens IP1]|uniref:UBC core domain-containing protein n=1 Tax=Entamoeba invadens IP1 TaxID=370355 RepID=L7FL11_ENTIV|nr:hypothetical protein EIN_145910 [Entamoeba invadens IP1]ELP87607.1 hypothetical protein EIN_145910 [Entamoeba invadens IP1]|eukprot:XP_004254378.1 hypothetical protein EIN_145910 [Entamoeba invadens IP1]